MTKHPKTAKHSAKHSKATLFNWPPSRGPMPAQVRALYAKSTYEIPKPEIETIEWTTRRRPASEILRVPTPAAPKVPKNRRQKGIIYLKDFQDAFNAQRRFRLKLNHSVVSTATLKPRQWNLIHGATLCPSRKVHPFTFSPRGGVKAYASLETQLPTRTITVDLSYPLSRIARVTIRPYTRLSRRGEKCPKMSIGYLLWQLARAYRTIYRRHKHFGVWGHAIGDLHFELFALEDNVGQICIGS